MDTKEIKFSRLKTFLNFSAILTIFLAEHRGKGLALMDALQHMAKPPPKIQTYRGRKIRFEKLHQNQIYPTPCGAHSFRPPNPHPLPGGSHCAKLFCFRGGTFDLYSKLLLKLNFSSVLRIKYFQGASALRVRVSP